jgi:hypothetical protein
MIPLDLTRQPRTRIAEEWPLVALSVMLQLLPTEQLADIIRILSTTQVSEPGAEGALARAREEMRYRTLRKVA